MASKQLGQETTETHLLTHIEWNGMPEMFSYGSNETGIRDIKDGQVVAGSFRLIQHGWVNWKLAGEIIKLALRKGWDTDRICRLLENLDVRKRKNNKAKTI